MSDEIEDDDYQGQILENLKNKAESCVKEIRGIADSVQIIATYYDPVSLETHTISVGDGNWHARTGAAEAWLLRDRENAKIIARRNAEDE